MLRPTCREETVVARVEGYPGGGEAVVLSGLVDLNSCSFSEASLRFSTVVTSEGQSENINFDEGCAPTEDRRNGSMQLLHHEPASRPARDRREFRQYTDIPRGSATKLALRACSSYMVVLFAGGRTVNLQFPNFLEHTVLETTPAPTTIHAQIPAFSFSQFQTTMLLSGSVAAVTSHLLSPEKQHVMKSPLPGKSIVRMRLQFATR